MVTRRQLLAGSGCALALLGMPGRAGASTPPRIYRVPIMLSSRRLVVSSMIEGQGPYSLGIDTGAVVSMIAADLAQQLRLRQRGFTPLGIAGRYERFPMFEAREVIFGNSFRQESVLLAGVEHARFGQGVVGMLAAGCLTTMDSELDFRAMEWRLLPDGGPERQGWVAHDSAIRAGRVGSPHLYGEAVLGGERLRCLLDTGAPGPIILFANVARKAGIDLDGQNWSPAMMNRKEARIYRSARPLQIGGLTIERPLISVTDQAPNFIEDGIVGLPIIQRLNLATEVKAGRLWTRPSGLPAERARYNLSGLWIDEKGSDVVVARVGKGSPAERAGIVRGDRFEGLAFRDLLDRLNGRPGEMVKLIVAGARGKREVTLTLEEYV